MWLSSNEVLLLKPGSESDLGCSFPRSELWGKAIRKGFMKRAVHGVTKFRQLGKFLIGKDGGKEYSWQQGNKGMRVYKNRVNSWKEEVSSFKNV